MPLARRPPPASLWRFIHNSNGRHWPPKGENIQRAINDLGNPPRGKVWLPYGLLDIKDTKISVGFGAVLEIEGAGYPNTQDDMATVADTGTIIRTDTTGPVIELEAPPAGEKVKTHFNLRNLGLRINNPKNEKGLVLNGIKNGLLENLAIDQTDITFPDPAPPYYGGIGIETGTFRGQHTVKIRNVTIWRFWRGIDCRIDHVHFDGVHIQFSNNVGFRLEAGLHCLFTNCHCFRCGGVQYGHGGTAIGGVNATYVHPMMEIPAGLPTGYDTDVTLFDIWADYPPNVIINPQFKAVGVTLTKYKGDLTKTTILENWDKGQVGVGRSFGADDSLAVNDYLTVGDVSALPTPSETYRGRIICVLGGAGVADTFYMCLKSAADTYSWVAIATG